MLSGSKQVRLIISMKLRRDDLFIGLGLSGMGSDSGRGASTSSASTAAEDFPYVPLAADAIHEIADVAYKT